MFSFVASDASLETPNAPSAVGPLAVVAYKSTVSPSPSEVEDLASKDHVEETPSVVEETSLKYDHLWRELSLPKEMQVLLNSYARLDIAPFMMIERTTFKAFRRAQIESLGEILVELTQWSFERLESEESQKLAKSLEELEGFGVPCQLLKKRLADLRIIKPVETRALLSMKTKQYNIWKSRLEIASKRREAIGQQLVELQSQIKVLKEEEKTSETMIKALEGDVAKIDEERTKVYDLISPYLPQAKPLDALTSVKDFFLT